MAIWAANAYFRLTTSSLLNETRLKTKSLLNYFTYHGQRFQFAKIF